MGGFSYDRSDYSRSSYSSWSDSYSSKPLVGASAKSRMSATTLRDNMRPEHRISSKTKTPIVFVLDVTGSNIDVARIVYDKFPMLHGQIQQQGYLKDFDICIMAVGDARVGDLYPLQVGNFAKGIEIDKWLEGIVLEGKGGPYGNETYEIACSYLLNYMDLEEDAEPIIFFQGDEIGYPTPVDKWVVEKAGMKWMPEMKEQDCWKLLKEKYKNIFFLNGDPDEYGINEYWENILSPEHVISVGEKEAIVDIILGVIAMVYGTRNLDEYKVDMIDKGQTDFRVNLVAHSLKPLSTALAVVNTNTDISKATTAATKSTAKAKRL